MIEPRGKVHMIGVQYPGGAIQTACHISSARSSATPNDLIGTFVRHAPRARGLPPTGEFRATLRATLVDCMNCRRRM